MLLEKSAEVQSVIRGLHGQIMGFEGRRRRGGARGRSAPGVLRGQGRRHTVFSHQDLAEDDGEQKKEKSFGRVRIFSWRLAPDHSWVEDPTAALSVAAVGTGARGRGHRGLWERVEGEDLRTRASPGAWAGGGYRGSGPQDGHGGEGAARVTHCTLGREV